MWSMFVFRRDVRIILWESLVVRIRIGYVEVYVDWIEIWVYVVVKSWVFGLLVVFIDWMIGGYWIIIIVVIKILVLKIDVIVIVDFLWWNLVFICGWF